MDCSDNNSRSVPTKYLWVGNIPMGMKRRDLEHAFSRYGQIRKFEFRNGDLTAVISYSDVEDATKARTNLIGAVQLIEGRVLRHIPTNSSEPPLGFRIDYLDKPTNRRFVIVRPQSPVQPAPSRSPSSDSLASSSNKSKTRSHAALNELEQSDKEEQTSINPLKTERRSPSPITTSLVNIKERRSTDRSDASSPISLVPVAGRTFYSPLGSYLSPADTENIHNVSELMILCEQLNEAATQKSTALSTVYPVQFILKSRAYDARLHFLAGSPTLASILLGQPGDLVAAKTELKITQRLRLDQHKLDDLERNLFNNVINARSVSAFTNGDSHSLNDSIASSNRKQNSAPNQTKFVMLIASPKSGPLDQLAPTTSKDLVKSEAATPPRTSFDDQIKESRVLKQELIEHQTKTFEEDDESSLSRLIFYLTSKEAAGVISIPFYPTHHSDHSHSLKQEIAVLHIFPSCEFSQKMLKLICPSIQFSALSFDSKLTINDEHLMLIIVHND